MPLDYEIIERFRHGDTIALSAIHTSYGASLYYFAKRFVKNKETSEELVSDTFIKLWKLRQDFESETHIRSFLYIAIKNACLDYLRANKRRTRDESAFNYLISQEAEKVDNPLFASDELKADVLKLVIEQIEHLPQQCNIVLKLAFFEGLDNEQIAKKMDLSVQTVKNHKVRGLQMLRLNLGDVRYELFLLSFVSLL